MLKEENDQEKDKYREMIQMIKKSNKELSLFQQSVVNLVDSNKYLKKRNNKLEDSQGHMSKELKGLKGNFTKIVKKEIGEQKDLLTKKIENKYGKLYQREYSRVMANYKENTQEQKRNYDKLTKKQKQGYDKLTKVQKREYDKLTQEQKREYNKLTQEQKREYDKLTQEQKWDYIKKIRGVRRNYIKKTADQRQKYSDQVKNLEVNFNKENRELSKLNTQLSNKLGHLDNFFAQNKHLTLEQQRAKLSIINKLQTAFAHAKLDVQVDPVTGDAVLSFNGMFFDFNRHHLKPRMKSYLKQFLPVYSKTIFSDPKIHSKIKFIEIIGHASPINAFSTV